MRSFSPCVLSLFVCLVLLLTLLSDSPPGVWLLVLLKKTLLYLSSSPILVWDLDRGGAREHEFSYHMSGVQDIDFSPDGRLLVSIGLLCSLPLAMMFPPTSHCLLLGDWRRKSQGTVIGGVGVCQWYGCCQCPNSHCHPCCPVQPEIETRVCDSGRPISGLLAFDRELGAVDGGGRIP